MDLQNYKAASERTDADERALIPPWNKAHTWRQARLEELQEWYLSACKGRQEAQTQVALLQAHADKLAEALRDIAADAQEANEKRNAGEWDFRCTHIEAAAKQALAAYKESL